MQWPQFSELFQFRQDLIIHKHRVGKVLRTMQHPVTDGANLIQGL